MKNYLSSKYEFNKRQRLINSHSQYSYISNVLIENLLMQKHCIDLFAGTGALGFEAASRNAELVVLLERDKKAYNNLRDNLKMLQSSPISGRVEIAHKDSLEFLKQQADRSSDLIFIDPPFQDSALLDRAVVEASRVCDANAGGGIYVEFPYSRSREEVEALIPDWDCGKYLEAGAVKACLFRGRKD